MFAACSTRQLLLASARLSLRSSSSSSSCDALPRLLSTKTTWTRGIVTTTFKLPDPAATSTNNNSNNNNNRELTKIVATIGPTSEQAGPLQQVTQAGMKIMRLNFSHATVEEVELRCTNLAAAEQALSPTTAAVPQTTRAVLLDTKGPEIRSGKLAHDESGHATMTLVAGDTITLQTDPARFATQSTTTDLYIDYAALATAVQVGGKVLLDDGAIVLTVTATNVADGTVTCHVDNSGDLRSRAGVNLPLADTSDLPALSDKDKADIAYGLSKDIDYVAASFVQTAAGVRDIKAYIAEQAAAVKWQGPLPLVISKIETASALQHFDEILAASDGIMVARGDLGVEIPLTQVCNAQKEMVHACNAAGKPVIVATQMLESMAKNPRPTRAEVADVTNAVYDGADCVMLSGESAKGKYPDTAVRTMHEIIRGAELYQQTHDVYGHDVTKECIYAGDGSTAASLAKAAANLASGKEKIKALVVTDESDNCQLAKMTSAFRPSVPIYALSSAVKPARQLQVFRGIHPVIVQQPASSSEQGAQIVKDLGYLEDGDFCAVLSATQLQVVQV